MYSDLEVTILYVIQMSNEVHLIDLPRFTAISREWKTIGQILKPILNCVQPVGLCIMVTPKSYDPVLAVRSYIVAMIYRHSVSISWTPHDSFVEYPVYI